MSSISITSVSKRFPNGVEALNGINTEIQPGSFTVVLGPSGAGKSTLLRMMNGLETPSSGNVRIGGDMVCQRKLRQIRCNVSMVFQQFNLVNRLSVVTNVLTGRLAHRSWLGSVFYLFRKEDLEIARDALSRVSLTDKAWERADKLSGGQQQRVGIARALAQQPKVILADEPVASLDPVASEEIMTLLREICSRDGITVVVNLHQVELARRFADRIIGMSSGKIVFDDSPKQMTQSALRTIYQREGMEDDQSLDLALAYA
jgi:phosphonate transport system ATP-binding protein